MWHKLDVVYQAEQKLIAEQKIWRWKLFPGQNVRDSKLTRFPSENESV